MAMSDRLDLVNPSEIRKLFDIAAGMKDVISLGIGEPDFDTPQHIKEYAKEALDMGLTHYGPNIGLPELREAIAEKLKKQNNIEADPNKEIMVLVGANQAFLMGLSAFLKDGEEVLIPTPAFVSYAPAVILAGGKPVEVPTYEENEFRLNVDELKKYVTEKTKALIINSPCNPTGSVLKKKDLEEIADFAVEHDLIVISDEVYEHFIYDDVKHYSIASLDGMFERTITVNGFSKTFAMTGWRLGFVAAPSWIIEKMVKFQMYNATCPVTFIQYAAAKALRDERSWKAVEEMRKEYDRRRKLVWKRLNEMGLPTVKPKGAFYIFPRIKDTGLTSKEFSELMLMEAKVAVVPGSAFGKAGEGYVRISYATAYEKLEEAMDRMEKVLREKKLT
ncbi:pyridoxal phosphate-dependent aminotransferase [Pyrococcus abyssi]|uniref:Aspartate aminotransferase n=1 Tax=Pyrococcus abyssi (strain GE5 / Orsay) TaxID=272844 RepID=AAT_PYRAB|nr:pyridoxal phosphate-dependent aminotransferase [Pyrococcus abyssi]Q9V0L2.1 RecName: Full=Aspartate aminotransferase; Short=AspAT; AltName: Full=Transaminase A [Pyrococcus abyssi GE5]CAB49691.1 aspC-1 aspartate aminotransferase (EC 2.6.1.1) [Pyrococcus abyssi GE5]CCE70174.1 TPA: aspartate aminotransferase [Pyrococcus abyssi GE5]